MESEHKRGELVQGCPGGPIENCHNAPRCGARAKRTGQPCRAPAMANGRCYYHGGASTGPTSAKGVERCKEAATIHGHYSAEALSERKRARQSLRGWRDLLADIGKAISQP